MSDSRSLKATIHLILVIVSLLVSSRCGARTNFYRLNLAQHIPNAVIVNFRVGWGFQGARRRGIIVIFGMHTRLALFYRLVHDIKLRQRERVCFSMHGFELFHALILSYQTAILPFIQIFDRVHLFYYRLIASIFLSEVISTLWWSSQRFTLGLATSLGI